MAYKIDFRILKSGKIVKERISTNMSKAEVLQKYKNNLDFKVIKIKEIAITQNTSFLRRFWKAFLWLIEDIFTN